MKIDLFDCLERLKLEVISGQLIIYKKVIQGQKQKPGHFDSFTVFLAFLRSFFIEWIFLLISVLFGHFGFL